MSNLYDMRSGTLVKSKLYNNGLLLKYMMDKDKVIEELFAGDKQGVWYDPSDITTLFQDVEGTVPVTKDGDPVALMKDKSGNGNHATQSVSTARPVYKTDGILHWLEIDGIDDYFNLPAIPMPNPNRISVHAILPTASVTSVVWNAFQKQEGFPDFDFIINDVFDPVTRDSSNTYIGNNTGVIVKDKVSVISSEILGSLFSARVGLNDYVTKSFTRNSSVAWGKAALFSVIRYKSYYFKGKYFGGVVLLDTPTTQNQLALYLAAKAGVTL